ncbi:MAG TPA: thermonuclease family protein [Allosphingosinicella sp.]
MGQLVKWRRGAGRGRRRRAKPVPPAQVRLMLWSGMLAGLLAFQASRYSPPHSPEPRAAFPSALDPYGEARRSKAILEAQEGAPPAVEAGIESERGNGTAAAPGSLRVIDGDTFVHDGNRIRIADIDTPEVHGRCPQESALAAKATRRLRTLLALGPFDLHPLPSGRDRYGRQLRIVTRDGRSIGDVLVAEGLARTWSGRREGWCR